jgi:hypothetical protein
LSERLAKKLPPGALGEGTNIFLGEFDVLDVCVLVVLAGSSRRLDIF